MFMFVLSIVALLVALGVLIVAENRGFAFVPALLAVVFFVISVTTVVPTQQIGIPVTFGKPGAPLTNGMHAKAPWTKVVDMDGTVQFTENLGDHRSDIRLGTQSNAYVQNVVGWRIKPEAADKLYRDHRKFENVGLKLVNPAIANALNEAFKDYDPLQQSTGKTPALSTIAAVVKKSIEQQIGDRIEVVSVTIPKVDFDEQTQRRIDMYQTELANTRIAEQRKQTATAEAASNKILSESLAKDPNVLVSKCMDQLAEMVEKKLPIPIGFTCWPSSGQQTIVSVPAPADKGK